MTFKVREKQCDQCLFSVSRIVSLKRMREIVKDCTLSNSHFICHKATIEGKDVCCRGFYDTQGYKTNIIRIAERLKAVEFVE